MRMRAMRDEDYTIIIDRAGDTEINQSINQLNLKSVLGSSTDPPDCVLTARDPGHTIGRC